jgi:hypothetical protein
MREDCLIPNYTFMIGKRYFSNDGHEMTVVNRFNANRMIRAEHGFGLPANYKIHVFNGREQVTIKGHLFKAHN